MHQQNNFEYEDLNNLENEQTNDTTFHEYQEEDQVNTKNLSNSDKRRSSTEVSEKSADNKSNCSSVKDVDMSVQQDPVIEDEPK